MTDAEDINDINYEKLRALHSFWWNQSTTYQILTICQIIGACAKISRQRYVLFEDFSKVFDSIHREKMEQILLVYGPPKETVTAIMMLYKNAKSIVHSPDGDKDVINIVTRVL